MRPHQILDHLGDGAKHLLDTTAAPLVWGSGNREGGYVPPDRDIFVEAVAGPKEEQ